MIKFSNDREISSVIISTALGFGGDGMFPYIFLPHYRRLLRIVRSKGITISSKSSTINKLRGRFILFDPRTWKYIQRLPDMSMLNSYGLTNNGVDYNAQRIAVAHNAGFNVIPNFYPEFSKGLKFAIKETLIAIKVYRVKLGNSFWILELDVSCLNSNEKINKNMRQVLALIDVIKKECPWLKLIIKTSVIHPLSFYGDLENAGVDVVHCFNTIPHDLIFPNQISPLVHVGGGGVSGGATFSFVYEKLQKVVGLTNLKLILGCGVSNATRARKLFALGEPEKTSIAICTAFLRDPKEAEKILKLN